MCESAPSATTSEIIPCYRTGIPPLLHFYLPLNFMQLVPNLLLSSSKRL